MSSNQKDKHSRIIAKASSWRFFATADTIFLSWLFTGQIESALKIGLTEVLTKIGLFYLHERMWERFSLGRTFTEKDGQIFTSEKHYRSVIKGTSWRVFGTLDTMLIAFFWTGDYTKALAIGGTEVITKIALFWIHERVWMRVKWGRPDAPVVVETEPDGLVNATA